MPVKKLKDFLDQKKVEYEIIRHPLAYTALQIAHAAHIHEDEVAKTVIVKIDDEMAMAVLPANLKLRLQDLREMTGAEDISFATEDEFNEFFPGCETGAMPPFGNLYGMDVYVSPNLAGHEKIAFNAGSHRELVQMRYDDYERLVEPQVLSFAS